MAQRHTTTCASCFTEIEYGAICNCTDVNEVNDQYLDGEVDGFYMGDEGDYIDRLSELQDYPDYYDDPLDDYGDYYEPRGW